MTRRLGARRSNVQSRNCVWRLQRRGCCSLRVTGATMHRRNSRKEKRCPANSSFASRKTELLLSDADTPCPQAQEGPHPELRPECSDAESVQSAPQVQRRTSETHEKKNRKHALRVRPPKKQKNGVPFSSTSRKACQAQLFCEGSRRKVTFEESIQCF